jgi:hypothetical protein
MRSNLEDPLAMLLAFGVPGSILFSFIYWRYLKTRFFTAFMLTLAAIFLAIFAVIATDGRILDEGPAGTRAEMRDFLLFVCGAWMFMVMCGLGLLGKVYRAWIGDNATPAEREPNAQGIRAWLGVGNLLMGTLFVATAYVARGWNPVGTIALVTGALLAYPLVHIVLKTGESPMNNESEEVADERRRVLAMVEAGKINGEDGAELIGALGQSHATASPAGLSLSGNRRVMMLGAVLVVVGFCLPWFDLNLGEQSREMVEGMQRSMQGFGGNMPQMPSIAVPEQRVLELSGGDIEHGLGWIILVMSATVSLLPLVQTRRPENRDQQRAATLIGMIVGTVLVMYLVAKLYRFMDIGIVVVMAGYVVSWVGVAREYLLPPRLAIVSVRGA